MKFIILKSLDHIYHIQTPDLKNIASAHAPAGSAKDPLHEPTPGLSTSVSQSYFKVHNTMEVDGEQWGLFTISSLLELRIALRVYVIVF